MNRIPQEPPGFRKDNLAKVGVVSSNLIARSKFEITATL